MTARLLPKLNGFALLWLIAFNAAAIWVTIANGDRLFDFTVFLSGVLCVFLAASGNILTYPIGLYNTVGYAWLSWQNGLYGEVGLNLLFFLPMNIIGFFMWRGHMDDGVVAMRALNGKQGLWILLGTAASIAGLGVGLSLLPGQNTPYIDAATNALSIVATFLMLWRYKEQWLGYIALNVLSVVMWVLRTQAGSPEGPVMIVMWSAFLINAFYGYAVWSKGARQAESTVRA